MAASRLAVEAAKRVVVLRAELDAAHVLDPDLGAGLGLADDDVRELLLGDQPARSAHRVGELLVLRRWPHPDAAGRCLQVLLLDGVDDVRRGQRELRQLVGLQPDPHPVVGAAEEIDLGDAGCAAAGRAG
jgi:hypothetical protein